MNPRREPALIIGVISAALSLLVTLNFHGLTSEQAALIVAAITAVGGVITAVATRPVAPAAFTALIAAVAALLAGFHFNLDPATVAAFNGLVLAVLTLVTRHQVTPVVATPARLSR
jgi:ABC-type thiamin/hydroxymethylpyrimidine transport system permease subunit